MINPSLAASVVELINKSANTRDANDAMKFSQSALNIANAIALDVTNGHTGVAVYFSKYAEISEQLQAANPDAMRIVTHYGLTLTKVRIDFTCMYWTFIGDTSKMLDDEFEHFNLETDKSLTLITHGGSQSLFSDTRDE